MDSPLRSLAALAREAGATDLAVEANALADRMDEGRFYVAVVGQFKRGKSTLINALVRDSVLPVGVVPVTAVVTVVRYGARKSARVRAIDGAWREIDPSELTAFVSEEGNPENAKGVAGVEVFVPSILLVSGLCLVDTPGLGSVFTAGTSATRAFVPHVDAALMVLGADPPITEDELALAEEVSRQVRDIVVVLNKADRVSESERMVAMTFSRRVLRDRLRRDVGPLLGVSATEQLTGTRATRDWNALVAAIERLSRESGVSLVQTGAKRGLHLLAKRLLHELQEEHDAFTRPVEESERRIEALRRCAADAERAMNDLSHLWTGEQERLRKTFNARKVSFLDRTIPEARREFSEEIKKLVGHGPTLRGQATTLAQDLSRRWLDRWRSEEQPAAEELYRQAARRFVELANQFFERLASSGEPALAILPRTIEPEVGFREKSRLYYTELWQHAGGTPLRWLADQVRSRSALLTAIDHEGGEYLETLLTTNGSRIENDFNDRVLESRRLLESELRGHLREVYSATERALARARERLAEGSDAVKTGIARIDDLRRRIEELIQEAT